MGLQSKSIIFKEGYYAYKANPWNYNNPYVEDTYEWLEYREGWQQADFEDRVGNDWYEGFQYWGD